MAEPNNWGQSVAIGMGFAMVISAGFVGLAHGAGMGWLMVLLGAILVTAGVVLLEKKRPNG